MAISFVTGEAALMIGTTLVVADLHLGAEHDYRAAGIRMPSQTNKILKRLEGIVEKTKARRLVILGDVKHKVPGISFQEEKELPDFLKKLSEKIPAEVVPGNHDGGLAKLCPGIKIHQSSGVAIGSFWLCHGHSWPGEGSMETEAIIMGHDHPQIEFIDKLGHRWRERVWIKAKLLPKLMEAHYKNSGSVPRVIFMPAFGELVGGWAVNRVRDDGKAVGGLGPLTRCADMKHAEAFMLDGTFLGEIHRI
jgi:uncharacterized protein